MAYPTLPADKSLDDVILQIKTKATNSNPNIGNVTQIVLKNGPRVFKIATLLEILNPKNNKLHHYSLRIDHLDKSKSEWTAKPERSMRLEGDDSNEIELLYQFLQATHEKKLPSLSGEHHLISSDSLALFDSLKKVNLDNSNKLNLINSLLSELDNVTMSLDEYVHAFDSSSDETLKQISVASRVVEYTRAFKELKALVNDPSTSEITFQKHLEKNPWMFGSEYSEIVPRKTWTRDDNLDFMLRRTVDDYLEIIEIKTAFTEPLFLKDTSHDSYYPSAKLSPVVGQVIRYIEEVERHRDAILVTDGFDTLKIRARAIVGRNGSKEHLAALRNFNGHLHRIEVITYDQLLRIAGRVLTLFGVNLDSLDLDNCIDLDDDEIPF